VSISRRQFVSASTLSIAAAWARPLLAQQAGAPPAPAATKFEEIRRGVGMFTATGGTIGYLITKDGALVVDSQYAQTAPLCIAGLKEKAPSGIELLINTHHHGDHTGGNAAFKPLVKRIVAHVNCVEWHKRVAAQSGNAEQQAFADTTFTESWMADFGGETVHARHFGPGHTSGDAVIFFEKANVMHGGDLLFRRVHPRVDGPAGASVVNWISILEKMAAAHSGDTAFIFGHGKDGATLGKASDVLYFKDYLSAAVDHVRRGLTEKQSKEEIAKATTLKGFEDVGQINPRLSLAGVLESIYDELT
jgi:glyoxylase-like metal-dependent hydrolase (beta-lactamase superfamily II)